MKNAQLKRALSGAASIGVGEFLATQEGKNLFGENTEIHMLTDSKFQLLIPTNNGPRFFEVAVSERSDAARWRLHPFSAGE